MIKSTIHIKRESSLEEYVLKRSEPFKGLTPQQIEEIMGIALNKKAKNYHSTLTLHMLGIKARKTEEFEKAGIKVKSVRLNNKGMPDQSISFPYFKYKEIVNEDWETSTLRHHLEKKFLFIVYRKDDNNDLRLWKVIFWNIPSIDLDGAVRIVWEETVRRIRTGHANDLPKIKDSPVAHVRPHGRDANDQIETPDGKMVKKQCFWLNAHYIKNQIDKVSDN